MMIDGRYWEASSNTGHPHPICIRCPCWESAIASNILFFCCTTLMMIYYTICKQPDFLTFLCSLKKPGKKLMELCECAHLIFNCVVEKMVETG